MAEGPVPNPEFDFEADDDPIILPDPPTDPLPQELQQQLGAAGDRIQGLQGEIRKQELEAQKRRLVDTFHNEISRSFGLRPIGETDYAQFGIDDDGKTLFWTPGGKEIRVSATKGAFRFRALGTLASEYGYGGTDAVRKCLGFASYTSKMSRQKEELPAQVKKALQVGFDQTGETLARMPPVEQIEMKDLQTTVQGASETSEVIESSITETEKVLGTINDPTLPHYALRPGLKYSIRELLALDKAMQTHQGALVNAIGKLVELDKRIALDEGKLEALEEEKLEQTEKEQIKSEIRERLRGLKDERASFLEAAKIHREALRGQIERTRMTFRQILNEDRTLAERVRTLFREKGVTIVSILTAIGMAISTLVLALTGGGGAAPPPQPPAPKPSDKGGLKEWVKKQLQALGRALANLAGKAAAALPGVIGSIVSWLLGTLGKTATWFAENLWAVVVAAGALLFVAAREWLEPSERPKRR